MGVENRINPSVRSGSRGLHGNLVANLSEITRDAFNLSRCDRANPLVSVMFYVASAVHRGAIDRD